MIKIVSEIRRFVNSRTRLQNIYLTKIYIITVKKADGQHDLNDRECARLCYVHKTHDGREVAIDPITGTYLDLYCGLKYLYELKEKFAKYPDKEQLLLAIKMVISEAEVSDKEVLKKIRTLIKQFENNQLENINTLYTPETYQEIVNQHQKTLIKR